MFLMRANYLDQVPAEIDAVRALGQPDWAVCLEGQLAFLRGHYDEALRRFVELETSSDGTLRSRSTTLEAAVWADLGRLAPAWDALVRGIEQDERRGDSTAKADRLLAQAAIAIRQQRRGAARDACLQAVQADQSPLRLAQAAALLAQAGAIAEAKELFGKLPTDSPSRQLRIDYERIQGELLLAQHRPQEAWLHFQRAATLEPPGQLIEYLARGAEAAGERGTAVAWYQRMALAPGYYWRYPDSDLPGQWHESLRRYLSLTAEAESSARRQDLIDTLNRLDAFRLPPRLIH